jgi:hypothetical protein
MVVYKNEDTEIWLNDKDLIKQKFKIKDIGEIKEILKIKIIYKNDSIILNQSGYIQQLIDENKLNEMKEISNPCCTTTNNLLNESIYTQSEQLSEQQHSSYRSIIGAINYISNRTRPDISFITNLLSRFIMKPYLVHYKAAIRVLAYLKTTINYGLIIKKNNDTNSLFMIQSYSDASHANEADFKSTLGTLTLVNGNIISWNSRKSKTVCLNTMESEFYSLTEATMEVLYLKAILHELLNINPKSIIYCDNSAAVQLTTNDKFHARAKHINIKYYFIKEHITMKHITVKWISTKIMLADILTKPLIGPQFNTIRDQLLIQVKQ